jgi:hypothetical protein
VKILIFLLGYSVYIFCSSFFCPPFLKDEIGYNPRVNFAFELLLTVCVVYFGVSGVSA